MDSAVKKIGFFLFILYLLLSARLIDIAFINGEKLKNHPANKRQVIASLSKPRGKIISAEGSILAYSKEEKKSYKRIYPFKEKFAHITGYFSKRYGASYSELAFNDLLSGNPKDRFWDPEGSKPRDVKLSILKNLQLKAFSLLRQKGAIIAMEPKTGKVLCLVSFPSFNPQTIDEDFNKLKNDADAPLLNRATSGLYPPGSTFKVVTLASYLENGGQLDDIFSAPFELKVGGFRVTNFEKKNYGKLNVRQAFVKSVNTVFAQMGLTLGENTFRDFLYRSEVLNKTGIEIEEAQGHFPENLKDPVNLAWCSVGQGDLLVTPVEMLTVVSAVGNGGIKVNPTLLYSFRTEKSQRIFSEDTAKKIKEAMVEAVNSGTGRKAKIPGLTAAGKTGTAEVKNGLPHAWFAGFAPAEDPEIAVVVILENAGSGGEKAAPIFRELVKYYFLNR